MLALCYLCDLKKAAPKLIEAASRMIICCLLVQHEKC